MNLCNKCGSPASYIGLSTVDCTNRRCTNFPQTSSNSSIKYEMAYDYEVKIEEIPSQVFICWSDIVVGKDGRLQIITRSKEIRSKNPCREIVLGKKVDDAC